MGRFWLRASLPWAGKGSRPAWRRQHDCSGWPIPSSGYWGGCRAAHTLRRPTGLVRVFQPGWWDHPRHGLVGEVPLTLAVPASNHLLSSLPRCPGVGRQSCPIPGVRSQSGWNRLHGVALRSEDTNVGSSTPEPWQPLLDSLALPASKWWPKWDWMRCLIGLLWGHVTA